MNKLLYIFFISILGFSQNAIEKTEVLLKDKNYAEAEYEIAQFLNTKPDHIEAIELLGDAYSYQEKWDLAIKQYGSLVQLQPDNANYHYKYGGALAMKALSLSKFRALGLIGDIETSFLNAANLDTKHIEARWALVELYMSLPGIVGGSTSKALHYADELQQLSLVDGYLAKGYVYESDNNPKLAEKYYRKAIEVGGSVTCYEKLTNFYEGQNQPEKAIYTIERAQLKHQRNALHYQIGKICADYNIQLDKGEMSLNWYLSNYSVEDGVPKEWAYYRLAQIRRHKKDKESALNYINIALNMRSDFKQALEEKSRILSL